MDKEKKRDALLQYMKSQQQANHSIYEQPSVYRDKSQQDYTITTRSVSCRYSSVNNSNFVQNNNVNNNNTPIMMTMASNQKMVHHNMAKIPAKREISLGKSALVLWSILR